MKLAAVPERLLPMGKLCSRVNETIEPVRPSVSDFGFGADGVGDTQHCFERTVGSKALGDRRGADSRIGPELAKEYVFDLDAEFGGEA